MRVLALVLLLLINSFSLPLQAMNSHVMSANIPCNMQTMPEMMAEMVDEQTDSEIHTASNCQMIDMPSMTDMTDMTGMQDMTTGSDLASMSQSDCDMSGNSTCSIASALLFISINTLVIVSSGQTATILYSPISFPEQHPENLYRPPLID
jgi:hypothetical protein